MPEAIQPTLACTPDGNPRRVGVEIEFGGLDCASAARLVAAEFGGQVREVDPYRFVVEAEAYGPFTVELDTQYVHPGEARDARERARLESERLGEALEAGLRIAIGEVTRLYLPTEIVCPPIPLGELARLDALAAQLRAAGAEGSRVSVLYAFGLQLNLDVPAFDAGTLLSYLRAYMVSAEGLRREIDIDTTRRVLPFVQPYPQAYLRHVLAPGYTPDLETLIAEYLIHNPTRNRDLDMLPLFMWLAPDRVRASVDDPRLKARPALHYRLPDCRIDDPDWTIVGEWNRWAGTVEALVAAPARLGEACEACLRQLEQDWLSGWAEEAMDWLRR
jgi:hypothetical protein